MHEIKKYHCCIARSKQSGISSEQTDVSHITKVIYNHIKHQEVNRRISFI